MPKKSSGGATRKSIDLILSEKPDTWEDIFKALDEAGLPEDFMADRGQAPPPIREEL